MSDLRVEIKKHEHARYIPQRGCDQVSASVCLKARRLTVTYGCDCMICCRNKLLMRGEWTDPVLRSTKKILPCGMMYGWQNELVPALKFTFFVWEVRRSGSGESGVVVWRAARSCVLSIKKSCTSHSDTTSCSSNGSLLSSGRHRVRSLMLRSTWMI
jgi:hypothetical protein